MKFITANFSKNLTTTPSLTAGSEKLSSSKPKVTRHHLSMIWQEDKDGKLIAQWTLQD